MALSQKVHDELDAFFGANLINQLGSLTVAVATDNLTPNGNANQQTLTVDATAGGVQFANIELDTAYVFWSSETADCRVTFDGSAPTTTNGHLIESGSSGIWSYALANAAKFIRTTGTSAKITATEMQIIP